MIKKGGGMRARIAAALVAAVCLAGCGGSDEVIEADPGLVNSDVGGAGSEARVGEILDDLQTAQRPEGTVITLPENILFEFGSAELKPEAPAQLDKISEVLRFYGTAPVEIRGYSDSTGSEAFNLDIAERRAESVRDYLTGGPAIEPGRLTAIGFGERDPVAPNENPDGSDNPEGREQNRRVEIVLGGVTAQP